jgi:hypothetical protein
MKTARVIKSAVLIGIVVTSAIVLLDHVAGQRPHSAPTAASRGRRPTSPSGRYGLYRGHSRHTGLNAYAAWPAAARVLSTIRACAATARISAISRPLEKRMIV